MHCRKTISLLVMLALCLSLCACGGNSETVAETVVEAENIMPHEYSIRISELMAKNRAVIRDGDGDFSDWIELENYGSETVSLGGLYLGDKSAALGWSLPDTELAAGERLLIFADGKDRYGEELHCGFSLSEGESAYLKNSYGETISSLTCIAENADCSVQYSENGEVISLYPTPGGENSIAAYVERQKRLETACPLIISEAVTHDTQSFPDMGAVDWVELRNISGEPVSLTDYFLSDDAKELSLMKLPEKTLAPGECELVLLREDCFELNSECDRLYLSDRDGNIVDYMPLVLIPYGYSFGRMSGENGFFYFGVPTPGESNGEGCRYIAESPVCIGRDGIFNDVKSVTAELSAPGRIYYTTDGSLPTAESSEYTAPLVLDKTTVVRAISVEDGALSSRASTFNFIINENHTLPVAMLCLDDIDRFDFIWEWGVKTDEITGNLSFFEDGGAFSINCGMKLNGETSLVLPKKNMSLRFRGAYGDASLKYDLYGGGAAEFQNILLRAGQDYYNTVFRNELCQELCLDFSDSVISQRSRFCVLYVNGEYLGVYTLKEKTNEAMYAYMTGTDAANATALEANIWANTDLFQNVLYYANANDMSVPENYAEICRRLDVDSLIDWLVAEGMCANSDLTSGNLRYVKSSETGDVWKLMHYDLDATFATPELIYTNVISEGRSYQQITALARRLLMNPDFRDRFLTRAGEAVKTTFSNENILREIDLLAAEIEPELERDFLLHGRSLNSWQGNVQRLKDDITRFDWAEFAIMNLKNLLRLTPEEIEQYFR